MLKRSHKATFLFTICFVYVLDILLSGTMFGRMKVYAASEPVDIISVFVDKNVSSGLGAEINWFTNSYVGRNYKNPKVIVSQIDPSGISPADMVKINQNLYLEGEKSDPSRLVGTILIGDLKLPMVNKQGFIFPTVYPLVDFDKPKYYYNPISDYFEYQSEGNSQPEIWHSVINFSSNISDYQKYFNKLKEYAKDSSKRTSNDMRYEDILHQKQTANSDNFSKYINNYIFSEDLMYNRYTNLMVDVYNSLHNSGVVEMLSGYNNQVGVNLDDEYFADPEYDELKGTYKKELEKFWNLMKSLKKIMGDVNGENAGADPDPSPSSLGTLPNSKFINTMFIQKVVEGFMKDYIELYGTSYFDSKENRLSLGGKYIGGLSGAKADDHITIASKHDEVTKQLMMDMNIKLENAVDEKIEKEGYAMNVIIPTRVNKKKDEIYEVYYFGLPAEQIQDASQFGIFRGTFNNIRSLGKLDKYDYTSWMDYSGIQSIGATRGENSREVEASRGYDFSLLEYDQQEFERVKNAMPYSKHKKKRKNIDKFIGYYRAGYTPLNIDPDSQDIRLKIQRMDYTQLWNPFKDRSLGGWVFDIAGSRITTDDRKIGFTLGSEDDDDGNGSDDDEDQVATNTKSYSGYSDSYLGAEFFASAIKVTRDNGKRLKVHKRRVRSGGKPRISNWEDINLWNLGSASLSDGLFLLANGKSNNKPNKIRPEDYTTVQPKSDSRWNRYFKSVDSRFFHKSPTLEDLYGEYIQLDNVDVKAEMACVDLNEEDENEEPQICNGFSFKFTDIYPGTVVTQLYSKRGSDYIVTGGKVLFNSTAVWYEHEQEINFDGLIGTLTGGNKLYISYDNRDIYLPWGETNFDCEELNTDEDELASCEGLGFKINGHDVAPISEKYVDIKNDGTLIEFYEGAKILVYGKSYDLGGLKAILNKDTKVAVFTGRKLQIGGINEFTMERPIDSPRYLNFQGIAGDKITRAYPNVWKIPVFKEFEGKRQLMSTDEIEDSIKSYLRERVTLYNNDLKQQYANRLNYYNASDGGLPRSAWISKFDNFDRTISPLVQSDNTGMLLRSYQFLPDDYLIDQLATTWKGKSIGSDDMIKVLAEQLHYQNVMRQELPIDTSKKVLNEASFITSFADSNHKSQTVLSEYITTQSTGGLGNEQALELQFPYYNSGGYEIGYINSDGSDYLQFETTPPLIKLIQAQKAKSHDGGRKTKEQLDDVSKCGSKIPPSYIVSLTKRPQAFKCWLEEVRNSPFEFSISFVGSANDIFAGSGFKGAISGIGSGLWGEVESQMRQGGKQYSESRRALLKTEDKDLPILLSTSLHKKLDNALIEFDTRQPIIGSGVRITLNQKQDLGTYTISLLTTGSNCLIGNGSNLCNGTNISLSPNKKLELYYNLDPSKPHGVGDMLVQAKVCEGDKCVYRNFVMSVQAGEVASFKFITPQGSQIIPIARGNAFPLLIQAYDSNDNIVGTTPYNFSVSTEYSGGLIYDNQLQRRFEINSFLDAGFIYDSFSTQGANEVITISSSDGLTNIKQNLSLQIVDPLITMNISNTTITLPESASDLEKEQNGVSFIDLSKLAKLTVTLNNNQPLYSLIDVKSLGAKFIIGVKSKKNIETSNGPILVDTFLPVDQFIYTGGLLELYLYPLMKAGDDSIQLKAGGAEKSLNVTINPSRAKKTVLKLDKAVMDLKGEIKGVLSATDIWGNLIQTDTKVLLGLFGNISSDAIQGSGSALTIQGEKEITIKPKFPGGQTYIFATLVGIPFDQQYPDYASILVQNRNRPIENLNIAYLNLYGSDRYQQVDQASNKAIGSTILLESNKTLALTTQSIGLSQIHKSLLGMRGDGSLISFDGSPTSGVYEQSSLNGQSGYVTPYGWLAFGGTLDSLKQKRTDSIDNTLYRIVEMHLGQSNTSILVLQENTSTLDEFDKSVPSIQHSNNNNYDIGFGDYFKPLTNFAQGQSVGQSSMSFASEYVINVGDPSYKAGEKIALVEHTTYDAGQGEVVYSDPGKRIDQVMDIDWDKSGDKDLLIIYTDGTIRLLIAVGNGEYNKIGDLAYIADGIKKVYVGDGDGDGYQDVFVHTSANQLRFYKNHDGVRLDVDGYPICLDLQSENEEGGASLDGVYQWMLTDPDKDKVTDIVVLDKSNSIRLFLGGGGNSLFEFGFGGGNYISRDKLACDPARRERQRGKSTIVKSYAPQINNVEIRDDSLVHWNGLKNTEEGTINPNAADLEEPDKVDATIDVPYIEKPNASQIKQLIGNIKDQVMDIANPKERMEEYKRSLETTVTLDTTYKPVYESGTGEVVYKQLSSLKEADKLDVFKKFIDLNAGRLEDGDIVKVEVTLKNKGASKATYLEKLSGPWEVPLSGGRQVGFFAGSLNADHQFILAPGPSYIFMLDNISMGSNVNFGYHVVFRSQQLISIKHGEDHIQENGLGGSIAQLISKARAQNEDDDLPAWMEVIPLDGCAKFIWKIFAENVGGSLGSWFRESKIDIRKKIEDNQKKDEESFSSGFKNGFDNLVNDFEEGISKEFEDSYLKETWKQKGILEEDSALQEVEYIADSLEQFGNLSLGLNPHVGLFGGDVDSFLDNKIADLTKGLCEGFKLGEKNCSGIPILSSLPRNMAFLSPGDMQVMGCKIFKDKGLPLLRFPATLQTPVGPMPFVGPIGQKGPGDGFYWFGGGTYTSLLRVYFSPTLTAKLGIGICFGPYQMGIKLPKPFKDIAGNCIVFAVDPGIGKCEVEKNQETGKYVLSKELKNLGDTNVCNDDITVKNGPLKLVETAVNGGDNWLESVQGEYGLVVKLGGHANLTNYDSISLSDFTSKVRIEGGNPLDLKVKSSLDGGIVSCIMNQFADNQIRYIINNLTTLNLNIIIPDRQGLMGQGQIIGDVFGKAKNSDLMTDYNKDKEKILEFNTKMRDKQQLTKRLDVKLSNPFDKLAILFNESELIKISTRDVLVEIPWVYKQDIGKMKGIFNAWKERNQPIIEAWENTYKDALKKCEAIQNQFEREKCNSSANAILQVNSQLGQFDRSIRLNIETLDMYGQLPKQVYELLHGYDRYIYDVFNLAYGTIDAITSWFSKVARGFDAWVTFIISLTGIIKSWQILIDFSVNWKEKCSKCTVDNYSAYSCSFKGFCPKLPVFNIPPFKIPNITIDLSNLDFRSDIILPRFRFQPKRVGIFDNLMQFGLPDIPYPPGVNGTMDIKLPVIPVIPRPPDLSAISLPSFIPQIKFKGPTLPPAPRIPKIAPELAMAIDIASFLGRIFCIVKGGIGLVAEAGLKSRIEQMTQRTWNVEPFDSLKVLIPKPPLQTWNLFKPNKAEGGSFDMKFEVFADVKMYFDGIYALFDGIADVVNEGTRTTIRDSDQLPGVRDVLDAAEGGYNFIDTKVEEYDDINVNPLGLNQPSTSDYSVINNKIQGDLEYFVSKDDQINSDKRKLIASDIKRSYKLSTDVGVNMKGLEDVKSQAADIMQKEIEKNSETKDWVQQDYDGWLEHIVNTQFVSDDGFDISLKSTIGTIDKQTLSYLESYDIATEYIKTQKTVVGGYVDALESSNHLVLGMNKSDYDQSLDYLQRLRQNIDITEQANESKNEADGAQDQASEGVTTACTMCDKDGTEAHIAGNSLLLAQSPPSGGAGGGEIVGGLTSDPAAHVRGYFVKGDDENFHNVIANMDKGEELSKVMFEKDLNGDKLRELISWDDHNVYIKRAKNTKRQAKASAEVESYEFTSITDIEDQTDRYGYANDIKLWSVYHMPKEWKVAGQAYQSMTYSVDAEFGILNALDGFVVRYSEDINKSYEKSSNYKYMLILHSSWQGRNVNDINLDGVRLDISNTLIEYSDMSEGSLGVILKNIPRRRYMTQIAKLSSYEQTNPLFKFIPFISVKPSLVISKTSPWSLSETAGMQIIADTSAPFANISLTREKSEKVVTQGDTMYGTIKTYYAITGMRFDDSRVVRSRIMDGSNKLIFSGDTDKILVKNIYSDKPITYTYQFVGEDAAGNIGQKTVNVVLELPKLSLDDVQVNSIGQSEAISKLATDVDTGALQFIRIRNGVESVLQSAFGSRTYFDTTTNQVTITGGKFAFKQDIGFYDANGKFLNVSITPEGQIINSNGAIKLAVDFQKGVPNILLMQGIQELYRIYLKAKEMDAADIKLLNGGYELMNLGSDVVQLGQFSNGYCIKLKQGVCEVIISPSGLINVVKPYDRVYSADYGFSNGKVVYTLKKGKNSIAELKVKVEEVKR